MSIRDPEIDPGQSLVTAGFSSTSVGTVYVPKGGVDIFATFYCVMVPSGGTPTLDMYLQTSADQGVNWTDIAHYQFTTQTGTYFVQIRGDRAGAQSVWTQSDAALAGNRSIQGPWGDRLRVKYVVAMSTATGVYQFYSNVGTK